jgi:hypothetical protein
MAFDLGVVEYLSNKHRRTRANEGERHFIKSLIKRDCGERMQTAEQKIPGSLKAETGVRFP